MPLKRRLERRLAKKVGVAINMREGETCNKIRYSTRREANQFVEYARVHMKTRMESYHCPFCEAFHAGHRKNRGVKNREFSPQ